MPLLSLKLTHSIQFCFWSLQNKIFNPNGLKYFLSEMNESEEVCEKILLGFARLT